MKARRIKSTYGAMLARLRVEIIRAERQLEALEASNARMIAYIKWMDDNQTLEALEAANARMTTFLKRLDEAHPGGRDQ